jgi:rare lipoprotein A
MRLYRVFCATAFLCLVTTSEATAETGLASWYGSGTGTPACGGRVGPMTAAHKTLPCGSRVRVTTGQGRSVVVTVTDRGPFVRGRVIDLSSDAADALGLKGPGVLHVTVERL